MMIPPKVILLQLVTIVFSLACLGSTDSLRHVLKNTKDPIIRVNILNELAEMLMNKENSQAIEYAQDALTLSQKIDYSFGQSEAFYNLGLLSFFTGDYPNALEHYSQSLAIKKEFNDAKGQANIYVLEALIHENTSNSSKAQQNLFKALEIYELVGDSMNIGVCYDNIGISFYNQKQYEKSKEYLTKSRDIAISRQDDYRMAVAFNNLYLVNLEIDIDEAEKNIQKAIEINEKTGNLNAFSAGYNNMGKILTMKGKYTDAEEYFNKSIAIKEEQNNRLGLITSYNALGELFLVQGNYPKSLGWYRKAYTLAKEMGITREMLSAMNGMYKCHKRTGQYRKSTELADTLFILSDSVRNEVTSKELSSLEAQYQNKRKQQEIELLNQQNELKNSEIKRQRLIIWFSSSGLTLILVFITYMVFLYKEKLRANKLLSIQNQKVSTQNEEIQSQKEQLEKQTAQLRELDRAKTTFFSNVSHEFRTPLTLILGPLDDLIKDAKDDRQGKLLHMVKRQAGKLLSLINQLMALSKIEGNLLELNTSTFDLNSLIRRVTNSFASHAQSKGIALNYECSESSIPIVADNEKVETIITNLTSNAIKYTDAGGDVSVRVQTDREQVRISVNDTGRGIAPDDLDQVFNRFHRSRNDDYTEGIGIGLALAKELAELHRGHLTVDSTLGKGSTFTLSLPFDSSVELPADATIEGEALPNGHQEPETEGETTTPRAMSLPQLLLVEDNRDMQEYILGHLGGSYEVHIANDGVEGLAALKDIEPSLIISDVMMPHMDGFKFTQYVKTDHNFCHIPIILLSAKNEQADKLHGLGIRADDYITKPFSIEELQLRIRNIIDARTLLRSKFRNQVVINPSEITTTSIDEQFLGKALKLIEENMDNPEFDTHIFCKTIGISRTNLHRKLKGLTNLSTTEFIKNIRLKRAAQYLTANSHTISEIAYMVGFSSLSYFTRCFKELFGVSPKEYIATKHSEGN